MSIPQPLNLKDYKNRIRDVKNQMLPNSIAFIAAETEQRRSNDTYYRFRQSSDLYYLTGFNEPDALLVIIPGRSEAETILFCRDKDKTKEMWDGYRYGPEKAIEIFGIDDAFPIDTVNDIVPGLIDGCLRIYYSMGIHQHLDDSVTHWLKQLRESKQSKGNVPKDISDLRPILHELRMFKSHNEVKLMQRAADISADAHIRAMKYCHQHKYEYQLQAELEYKFALNNSEPAYSSIVGSGANACVLHYISNNSTLSNGNLVLIDAGAEYAGYASDITRTFPVNGKFSEVQKQLYNIVLAAQLAAIETCKVGNSFTQPHDISVEVITRGLVDLGVLKGKVATLIKKGKYKRFYPHRVGHWLGLDVHDVGGYKVNGKNSNWREFEVGMVTTIEPGIYIQPDDVSVDKKWRGIGIRIEDDVLITKKGPKVLSDKIPKTIDAIEALMNASECKK